MPFFAAVFFLLAGFAALEEVFRAVFPALFFAVTPELFGALAALLLLPVALAFFALDAVFLGAADFFAVVVFAAVVFFAAELFFAATGFFAAPFFLLLLLELELVFFAGNDFRFVDASSSSCFLFIDSAMLLEAPRRELFGVLPRFADNAAPAAFCCFLDFAGIPSKRE